MRCLSPVAECMTSSDTFKKERIFIGRRVLHFMIERG